MVIYFYLLKKKKVNFWKWGSLYYCNLARFMIIIISFQPYSIRTHLLLNIQGKNWSVSQVNCKEKCYSFATPLKLSSLQQEKKENFLISVYLAISQKCSASSYVVKHCLRTTIGILYTVNEFQYKTYFDHFPSSFTYLEYLRWFHLVNIYLQIGLHICN